MFRRDFILRLALLFQRHSCGHTMPAPLSYNGFSRGGSAAPAALTCIRRGRAARCRHRAATGNTIFRKDLTGVSEERARLDENPGPWTREACDDVDPMPDYENVLTD